MPNSKQCHLCEKKVPAKPRGWIMCPGSPALNVCPACIKKLGIEAISLPTALATSLLEKVSDLVLGTPDEPEDENTEPTQ